MSHHGEYVFGPCKNVVPEQMGKDDKRLMKKLEGMGKDDKRLMKKLEENHSDATKRMFSEFVLMHNELKSMGIDPERLSRVWNPARTG